MLKLFSGLSGWDWLELTSLVAIAVGAISSLWLHLKKPKCCPDENGLIPISVFGNKERIEFKRKFWEFCWEIILIIGLIGEIPAALHGISEAAKLNNETIRLRLMLQPRVISLAQRTELIKQLTLCPKGEVTIWSGAFDGEATIYASQIEDVLTNSGFKVTRPTFPNLDTRVCIFESGLDIIVKDLKKAPTFIIPMQKCFLNCSIPMWRQEGDSNFPSNHVVISVGPHLW